MRIPQVIFSVVNSDLCIGCGLCVSICPSKAIKMSWNDNGFLNPIQIDTCDNNGDCIKVCPFNPFPEENVKTENELASYFLTTSTNHHFQIGNYNNIYVGHSIDYRLSSSSGGIATYVLTTLLKQKIVDGVVTVTEGNDSHFEYKFIKNTDELLTASKTKYYPVTLSEAIEEISKFNGKIAVVGIGCFIKAIRLLQINKPEFKEKICFTLGIICGGLKSKFFGEYLAAKAGIINNEFKKPLFRVKDFNSNASDYSFCCIDQKGIEKKIKMKKLGDMWGTGMFKCSACDFCDDVTTELADISLGDAWFQPYIKDGRGNNIIIVRSLVADNIIKEGIKYSNLIIETLELEKLLLSQKGSFNHRHKALKYRINHYVKNGIKIPPKRHCNEDISLEFKIVQKLRNNVRKKSLQNWKQFNEINIFERKMRNSLLLLDVATKIYHYINKIKKYFKENEQSTN